MARVRVLLFVLLAGLPVPAMADTYLLMAEEAGCPWCAQWNADISEAYPKTAEGKAAPLRRYDLHGDIPDIVFARKVAFTPTFILVQDGVELDRIEGYPGEDFFWGLLRAMLTDADVPLEEAS